jgi:thiol-disulfide isomerase/thioredoxin
MKKFLLILTSIVSIFALSTFNVKAASLPTVTNHEKVTIYVFRGHGCSHCYSLLTYLYNNMSKYTDYMNVVAYEVWSNNNNQALMNAVASAKNETVQGVPYIVVGSDYSKNGYGSSSDGEAIINAALKEYQNDSYKDLVATTLKDDGYDVKKESLDEAASAEGISSSSSTNSSNNNSSSSTQSNNESKSKSNKNDIYIIVAIFAFIVGGITLLISTSNKN